MNIDQDALKAAFEQHRQRFTLCLSDDCRWGYVAPDPNDIDSYTEEPRRVPHSTCKGTGFVPRQMELPL